MSPTRNGGLDARSASRETSSQTRSLRPAPRQHQVPPNHRQRKEPLCSCPFEHIATALAGIAPSACRNQVVCRIRTELEPRNQIYGLSGSATVRAVAVQLATLISDVDGPKDLIPTLQLSPELHRDRGTLAAIHPAVPPQDVIDHPGVRVDQVLPCSIGAGARRNPFPQSEAPVNRGSGEQWRRAGTTSGPHSWFFRPSRRFTRRTAAYVSIAAIGAHPVPPWASQHPDESKRMRGAALVRLSHENQAVRIRSHRDRVPLSRLLALTLSALPIQRRSTSRAPADLLDMSIEA